MTQRTIQYLGFAGHDNLGDDAIRATFLELLPDVRFLDIPVGRSALLRGGWSHFAQARNAPTLIGGGTILGRTLWRHHIGRTDRFFKPAFWEMLGAGVEDPDFHGSHSYTSRQEIRRWKPLLADFRHVTVRGPRSQEILADAGIESRVVGDPALLLEASPPASDDHAIDILVNATCGEDQWGGTGLDWTPAVAEALRPMVKGGARLEFVSFEPTDDDWNRRIASALDVPLTLHSPRDHQAFFSLTQRAKVILGTRLHCNILAAAAGSPNIALEYRPKCRDFMASVGAERSCHRVDAIDPEQLRANITEMAANWADHQAALVRAVAALRSRLRAELDDVGAALTRA
jgi:hypothetical protein